MPNCVARTFIALSQFPGASGSMPTRAVIRCSMFLLNCSEDRPPSSCSTIRALWETGRPCRPERFDPCQGACRRADVPGSAGRRFNFSSGSFASKHLSLLTNQGGQEPTSTRRDVPKPAVSRRGRRRHAYHYSITSSARASSTGGIVNPSVLAVFRLITNSYLDACSTGRSPGLAPSRILPM